MEKKLSNPVIPLANSYDRLLHRLISLADRNADAAEEFRRESARLLTSGFPVLAAKMADVASLYLDPRAPKVAIHRQYLKSVVAISEEEWAARKKIISFGVMGGFEEILEFGHYPRIPRQTATAWKEVASKLVRVGQSDYVLNFVLLHRSCVHANSPMGRLMMQQIKSLQT